MKKAFRMILIGLGILLLVFLLIQLVPYGRNHVNPPVTGEPAWDSPVTRSLAKRACFDCHSNETVWPWYSSIAPVSWLVYQDVSEGRSHMNFSQWSSGRTQEPGEIAEVIQSGEMPPFQYLIMHPDASLSAAEKNELISGLGKSLH